MASIFLAHETSAFTAAIERGDNRQMAVEEEKSKLERERFETPQKEKGIEREERAQEMQEALKR